ncbi:hypothetical protein [Agrobacterium vitis]|uniref:hypothetical protein n=1 Tax=Agrobacterium vitis TaxID=373 RepID=UPI0015721776|nr:hypothetical protein [Agrobacterium vitis]NSZ20200.1 hypothetical protein [Agrobacterium vitis]QZO05115.1 hypothetical protein K4831_06200 [Agrobacterium vitis]UJL87263.1 hypothetical protein AVF2S5_04540 [Agrobacterium vitis]
MEILFIYDHVGYGRTNNPERRSVFDFQPNGLMWTFNGKKHVIKFEKFGLAKILKEKGIAIIEFFDEKSCAYIFDFEGNNLIKIKN